MITLTFSSIWVPIITVVSIVIPFLIPTGNGMFSGLETIGYLFIGLFFVAIAWPIYVFFLWAAGIL